MYKITCAHSRSDRASIAGATISPETPDTLALLSAWKELQREYFPALAEREILEICARNGWKTPWEKTAEAVRAFCAASQATA